MGGDQSSTWQILPDLDRLVWTQTVAIRERGRVSLPGPVRERLPWIVKGGPLLAVLHGDGSVHVMDWARDGLRVAASVRERYAALPAHQKAEFALAAMDSFMKLRSEKGGRITLPMVLRTQVDPMGREFVRIVVRDGRLEFWDDEVWKAYRTARISRLEEAGIL